MARILIVDDEEAFRSMLRRKLEKENHDVLEASDGQAGIELAREAVPDLIVADLIMPGKEGIEMIIEFKKKNIGIPVIAISGGGHGDPNSYLLIARAFGVEHTFAKPLDWKAFVKAVNELVA